MNDDRWSQMVRVRGSGGLGKRAKMFLRRSTAILYIDVRWEAHRGCVALGTISR